MTFFWDVGLTANVPHIYCVIGEMTLVYTDTNRASYLDALPANCTEVGRQYVPQRVLAAFLELVATQAPE